MLKPNISFAKKEDMEEIMVFISQYWRQDHVLSISRELFLYEFNWVDNSSYLTVAVARSGEGDLLGMFGFKFYNGEKIPDLAGSIWFVTEYAESIYPMIGVKLREYVLSNIPHRFFSTPGPGIQTKVIYKMLRLQWNQMSQHYRVNTDIEKHKIVSFSSNILQSDFEINHDVTLIKVENPDQLELFDFLSNKKTLPYKDMVYVMERFVNHPVYSYDLYLAFLQGEKTPVNLVVCRRATAYDKTGVGVATAYRVVDFYGVERLLPEIFNLLFEVVKKNGDEFLDFVNHGFDKQLLNKSGMNNLDYNSTDVIIPNWFEPLSMENIAVNCISTKTSLPYRQCKGDGDQDRPSMIV